MAPLEAMAVARVPSHLMGSSPPTLAMASSQLPVALQEGKVLWEMRVESMGLCCVKRMGWPKSERDNYWVCWE
jgi:hypothetical protein